MNHEHEDRGSGLLGKALALLLLGVILERSFRRIGAQHRHKVSARPERAPRRLQRWEGEGGNVMPPQTSEATTDASA